MKTQSYEYMDYSATATPRPIRVTLPVIPGVDMDARREDTAPRAVPVRNKARFVVMKGIQNIVRNETVGARVEDEAEPDLVELWGLK